jgi:ribosomal protein S18 acetylase RimI-like enzyme
MSDITIQHAVASQAETLLKIEQAAFSVYQAILDPLPSVFRETPAVIQQKMDHGTFLVACDKDQIVGMVFYQRNENHVYLGRLCVLQEWQGCGIARMLMQAVEERAAQFGLPTVQLAVRIALPQLIATYLRHGYRIIGEHCHSGYTHPTFVSMCKTLHSGGT